jgi:hypothetical protein
MSQTLISLIDEEISRLDAARAIIASALTAPSGSPKTTTVHTTASKKKRKINLTPEGRARIAAAVKARWAKLKKAAKA